MHEAEIIFSTEHKVEITATNYLNVHASGNTKVWYLGSVANSDISTTGAARVSRQ